MVVLSRNIRNLNPAELKLMHQRYLELQGAQNAATLRFQNGRVSVTDGPYAETKEQLAGFFVLEATDLNHAIQLMSKHPAVRGGAIEIRPSADPTEMTRETERRRLRT